MDKRECECEYRCEGVECEYACKYEYLHLEVCKIGDHLFGGLVVAHAVMLLVLRVA